MKNKILLLERIVKKQGIKKKKRKAIAMYLSVCFLALNPDGVANYFGVKYTRVRHFVTRNAVKFIRDEQARCVEKLQEQVGLPQR